VFVACFCYVWWANQRDEAPIPKEAEPSAVSGVPTRPAPPVDRDKLERGRYLAAAGNCMSCHTARGGVPFTGGRPIDTPFGTLYSTNLTPDRDTGLGRWSAQHFWRAMHNGRSRDGRLLYPAFPYPNFTRITREDSDAIFAYLQSLDPIERPAQPNTLAFPFNTQAALAVWRALFFTPHTHQTDPSRSADWNRGAYLVQGLGHCNACHSARNAFGATAGSLDLGGGLIPVQNWYAPSLNDPHQAGVSDWSLEDIEKLLKNGFIDKAAVQGPMAEVVWGSTQYLNEADLRGMATYLKALPVQSSPEEAEASSSASAPAPLSGNDLVLYDRGARIYVQHCARCHGDKGEGVPGAYPPLSGNRAVTMSPPANLVRIILAGGFPPATAGNPRPYGKQPFATILNNDDIAAVTSYIRASWGNRAPVVTPLEVNRMRVGTER
jgi:mono/diheme cytochrome c family protein